MKQSERNLREKLRLTQAQVDLLLKTNPKKALNKA